MVECRVTRGNVNRNERIERVNNVFAALADPTRRAILELLARGEARVTEVAEPFGISLNAVSKHIRVLERAGLVRRRVAGRDHFLAFDGGTLDEVQLWIASARTFWESRLDEMERVLETRKRAAERKK
jgi:DNA-binding transcriptional ArsR family regulator